MNCPVCGEDWESDGPFKEWEECGNCGHKRDSAVYIGSLRERIEGLEAALESMVRQFAYEGHKNGRPAYGTGGLSALEEAFSALGWNDPQPALDRECQAAGCHKWASCGSPTPDGYKWLCGDHYSALDNA